MIHDKPHPLAGKTVRIKESAAEIGGQELRVEDYWDRAAGKSWMFCDGNPACLNYAMRTGFSKVSVPIDDEVVYGKIGPFGHLVHVSELEQ